MGSVAAVDQVMPALFRAIRRGARLVGGEFTISSIRVLWPKKAADHIAKAGAVDAATAKLLFGALALAFPAYP